MSSVKSVEPLPPSNVLVIGLVGAGASAEPRLLDLEPVELRGEGLPYLLRERHAQDLLADIVEQREPKLSVDAPPRRRTGSTVE